MNWIAVRDHLDGIRDELKADIRDQGEQISKLREDMAATKVTTKDLQDTRHALRNDMQVNVGGLAERVGKIENGRAMDRGIAAGAGAVLGFATSLLGKLPWAGS